MYVGVGAVLLGEAFLFGSARLFGYALAVVTAFHLFVVLYEEPTLRRSFGAAYERYCERVPRWIGRVRAG
jgi:protein-S-isoprenylcysteine O-methyltransferase Ste14